MGKNLNEKASRTHTSTADKKIVEFVDSDDAAMREKKLFDARLR